MPKPDNPNCHGIEDCPNNFGPDAANYEKSRSQYPSALASDVLMAAALPLNASLLEIGSGTGRAPRLFTRRGYDITYIEPLAEMATIA